MSKHSKFTCDECTVHEFLGCEGYCYKCGWNPKVAAKRLSKKFKPEEILKLKGIPIVGIEGDRYVVPV